MPSDDEHIPLTCNDLQDGPELIDVSCGSSAGGVKLDGYDGCNSDQEDEGDDVGCTNYRRANRFLTGRYSGYCTLGASARVSLHDSWDFDSKHDEDGRNESNVSNGGEDEFGEDNGDFVSYWRHSDGGESSCDGDDSEKSSRRPQHFETSNPYAASGDIGDEDDDRVETTMRPIPLIYRKYQGGLVQSNGSQGGSPVKNFGSWFQRELGVANLHFSEDVDTRRRARAGNRPWGLGRKPPHRSADDVDDGDFDNSEEDEGGDTNSFLESSSSDDMGRCIPTQALAHSKSQETLRISDDIFDGRNRRGGGILALPIVRPFLRGRRRGFTDSNDDDAQSSSSKGVEDDDDAVEYADDLPSKRDRAAVVQSITQGIAGTKDDSLLLDASSGEGDAQSTKDTRPPNLLERIFLTRFLQGIDANRSAQASIRQLHNLLRKEDWSLATELLQSKPELAQTWHNVQRLYGGRYDGEALPIHAACALRPPPSFIEVLANLYPEGLLAKDKAFGRVPLHVACRSLAESNVINVLCDINPDCVEERDK